MAELVLNGSSLGNSLQSLLMADEIIPGSDASYELCKQIYLYHPLGKKMAQKPIEIALSEQRNITVSDGPAGLIIEAFEKEWSALHCNEIIGNVMRTARIYGIASVAMGTKDIPTRDPINFENLANLDIYFSVFDPLNTSGSLVLNQNPNAIDFQKVNGISVNGQPYHPSRSCTILNEEPIYISYTSSAFGFVGRSVYQRALYPLKSYVQSMITDDVVTTKAAVLIAKIKQVGAITDRIMQKMAFLKRDYVKEAQTGNVISIATDEDISTLNLQNTDTAMTTARKNIIENIASAASMPAQMLNHETLTQGFGEGSEDAKINAQFISGIRKEMQPLYNYFDKIVKYRAWTPEFYASIQNKIPEYRGVSYNTAFYQWSNSFVAKWPNLLIEPESEKIKVDEVKFRSLLGAAEILLGNVDQENRANIVQWLADNMNEQKLLFKYPLVLDFESLKNFNPMLSNGVESEMQNNLYQLKWGQK